MWPWNTRIFNAVMSTLVFLIFIWLLVLITAVHRLLVMLFELLKINNPESV